MATVKLTRHLRRFIPALDRDALELPAATLAELVGALGRVYPTLPGYLVDETGALRQHVNIFIDGELVRDRLRLSDPLAPGAVVMVFQALSGGSISQTGGPHEPTRPQHQEAQ